MPELPDLEAIRLFLNGRLPGVAIAKATLRIPGVVKMGREEFVSILTDNVFGELRRRGKLLLFPLRSGHLLALHPMLTGRLQYVPPQHPLHPRTCFILALADGQELRYHDERVMGRAYLVTDEGQVPELANLGPEPLDEGLTEDLFIQRLRGYRGPIKKVLLDEGFVAGIGNAYADEILFAAGLHPKRPVASLGEVEASRLYNAMRSLLAEAIPLVAERMGGNIEEEIRDFLQVHRRGGEPCPKCQQPLTQLTLWGRVTTLCQGCQG